MRKSFFTVVLICILSMIVLTGCSAKPDPILGKWMPFNNDLYGYYEFRPDNSMSLFILGGPEPIEEPGKYSIEKRKNDKNILHMTLDSKSEQPHAVAYDFSGKNLVLNLYPLDDLGGEPFKLSKIVSEEEWEAAQDKPDNRF